MSAILTAARGWLGTPYRHQASVRGEGADCLGLVRGLWREVVGPEPEAPPPYSPDWAEVGGEERLARALERWLRPIPIEKAGPGQVLLFRMSEGSAAKHWTRDIRKPVEGTVRAAVDGVELPTDDVSVDLTTGQIDLSEPPAPGASVTAGFEFDTPVRFDADRIEVTLEAFGAGRVVAVPLIEVRV